MDLKSCVTANNGLLYYTNSLLYISSVGSCSNCHNIQESTTLSELQWGKSCKENFLQSRSNIDYKSVYSDYHIINSSIDEKHEVKDNCIVQNHDITNDFERRAKNVGKCGSTEGLTFGYTNSDVHCTTVHSAHECQVSTRGSRNLSDSDHAALAINIISGSRLFRTKHWAKLRTNNNLQESMGQYVENSFIGTNGVYSSNYNDSEGPRWQSGNTLASHLCGRGFDPRHGRKWESW